MGLIKTGPQGGQRPEGIECPKWEPKGEGSKRCKHYAEGGACALPDEFMCVEWLRLNDPDAYRQQAEARQGGIGEVANGPQSPAEPATPRDRPMDPSPGANGAQRPSEAEQPAPKRHLGTAKLKVPDELATAPRAFDPALISDASLAELEAAGIEIEVGSADLDPVWLVPEHTGLDRAELTYRMARTLLVTMSVFPGSHLRALRRRNPNTDTDES